MEEKKGGGAAGDQAITMPKFIQIFSFKSRDSDHHFYQQQEY